MSSAGNDEWKRYGADFLVDLDEQRDWRSVEALWRFGGPADLTDLAKVMAGSGDARLSSVLVKALLSGRYADSAPTLPELLLEHGSAVTVTAAREVLDRLGDAEKPLKPPYSEKRSLRSINLPSRTSQLPSVVASASGPSWMRRQPVFLATPASRVRWRRLSGGRSPRVILNSASAASSSA